MLADHDRKLRMYRERVAGYDVSQEFRDQWRALCRIILGRGGELVVPPGIPEPDLELLLEAGALQGPVADAANLDGDCHANVAKLWIDGAIAAVGTGYALHDNLWRQHSWGIDADGKILETKFRSDLYYGVVLPAGERTVLFVLNSYDGDVAARIRAGGGRTGEIVRVLRTGRQRRLSAPRE
jgi:hypothetical protein